MSLFSLVVPLFLALATVWLLDRWRPLPLHTGPRVSSIDGLRGYLAFGVFLHHSYLWFFYLQHGQWAFPHPGLHTQLGEVSVALFFMITGFLFTAKLRKEAHTGTDWLRLYTSRVLRIVPLWLLVKVLVVVTALLIKRLALDSDNPAHLPSTASTGLMTAGVTWTLYYEWLFYAALPCVALLLRQRPALLWLLGSVVVVLLLGRDRLLSLHSLAFVGGMLTAWLAALPRLRRWASRPEGSLVALALLATVTLGFDSANAVLPCLLLTLAFVLIAAGAHFFGLLNTRLSRVFGEITFSIYLLHGFVLFLTFRFVLGLEQASSLALAEHWLVIAALTPVLMVLSFLSFRCLEAPAMQATHAVVTRLRTKVQKLGRRKPTV